jgi:hypothetical protein
VAKAWRFPLHALFLGLYPVLALLAANLQESPLEDGGRALAFGLLLAAALLFVLKLLLNDWQRAGVLSSVLLVSFYSYGHLYTGLKFLGDVGLLLARHRFLLPAWLLLTGLLVFWLVRTSRGFENTTSTLNFVTLLLVIFPLFQISSFLLRNALPNPQENTAAVQSDIPAQDLANAPDVYYIITDAYSRDDVMQSFYGFDNAPFLSELENLGFYVAECSLSNYPKTRLSLTSSLNMDYLEGLGITANDQGDEFWRRIRNSTVRKTFEALGYTIVSLETGFYWTEWPDADLYLSRAEGGVNRLRLNGFETLLLQTTLVRAAIDLQPQGIAAAAAPLGDNEEGGGNPVEHYEITSFALDALSNLVEIEGPKFVFAHLLIPHGPFVFDELGNYTDDNTRSSQEQYTDQVTYLNSRLTEAFTRIINESERPVVIVVQGDHGGPGTQLSHDRMKILNAYYAPEAMGYLYPSISPVNSFRLILDTYFGYDYQFVEDLSYYSTEDDFFNTTLITDDRAGCN